MTKPETKRNADGSHAKAVALWLFFCCCVVFVMVIVGAVTRLTDSGLSMVEWRPLIGALPPMSEAEWERVFALYQASPEFEKKHFWMELGDFKKIFFWEWFHRLLGRLTGAAYALPFLFFLAKGWIPKARRLKLFGIFLLGGAQGFMGWYMVKSGLVDVPAVSHYRLAAHLSLALLILVLMLWQGLALLNRKSQKQGTPAPRSLYVYGWICTAAVCVTILWGALTAGLDAGLVYGDSFPLMGGRFVPEEAYAHAPFWLAFFETHAGVQFAHRWLALTTTALVAGFAVYARVKKQTAWPFPALAALVLTQAGLGIFTLLSGVYLPLAVAHQAVAVLVLCLLTGIMQHNLRREHCAASPPSAQNGI